MARAFVALCLACLALPSALGMQALCNKDAKPSAPTNARVVRNEKLDSDHSELTISFGNPPASNNALGCAPMYRIELMEDNKSIVKENIQAQPMQAEVTFTRKLHPGKTYTYRITAINTMVSPARESDSATTNKFMSAILKPGALQNLGNAMGNGQGWNNGNGNGMGQARPSTSGGR